MKAPIYFMLLALLTANIHPTTGFSQCTLGSEYVTTTGTAGGTYNGGFEPPGSYTLNVTGTGIATGAPTFTNVGYSFFECTDDGMTAPEPKISAGKYAIMSGNSSYCWGSFLTSGVVHGGNFAALFDAPATSTSTMWCQTVTGLSPSTTYAFTAWYRNAQAGTDDSPPQVQMTIDYGSGATNLGTAATVSVGPYAQAGCYTQPPAGVTSATICIQMLTNGSGGGNDIFLDDISFKPVTSGSGCTVGTCTYITTPVELLYFTVKEEGNNAALRWSTASEKNSSYFSIEKSNDGINFSEIGTVNARGFSSNLVTYGYEDRQFYSTSYYRLKMVDIDGSYEYSRIAVLEKDEYVRIINRSEEDLLEIKAVANEDTEWNLAVYSLLGQEYLNEKLSLVKGENTILKKIRGGEQSAKIVRIIGKDGAVIFSEVVVW
jgi:hypothetical protein